MINNKKTITKEGFTIIEVLIVLAVAALILLIVLLAVPALQRNARNTNRKQDVGNLIAGINENIDNNNGTLPTGATGVSASDSSTITWTNTTKSDTKVSYFTKGIGTSATTGLGQILLVTTAADSAPLSSDRVQINFGDVCDSSTAGKAIASGGSIHSFAVQYTIESTIGGALTPVCQTS